MVFRHGTKDTLWIDLEKPSREELRAVASELGISERVETELADPTPSSLAAVDGEIACLVLHVPAPGQEAAAKNQEVDFAVGQRFVLTVHYEVIPALHRLAKLAEADRLPSKNTAHLLEAILLELLGAIRDQANHVASRLNRAEQLMFARHDRTSVRAISEINREFLHLEAALASEDPLGRFLEALAKREFFGAPFATQVAHIQTNWANVGRLITTYRAIATELRETNAALLYARQNEIVKTLTVITFIFLPLNLIAGVFQLDVHGGMPLLESENGFWVIVGLMFIVAGAFALFFTRKRWLF